MNSLNRLGKTSSFIDIKNHTAQPRIAFGYFKRSRKLPDKPGQRIVDFEANDRPVWPRHSNVGDKSRAFWQDLLISSLNMRVRPDNGSHPSI